MGRLGSEESGRGRGRCEIVNAGFSRSHHSVSATHLFLHPLATVNANAETVSCETKTASENSETASETGTGTGTSANGNSANGRKT